MLSLNAILKSVFTIGLFISIAFTYPGEATAQECQTYDPADTGVNVRASPNGILINRLRNWREVEILEIGNDDQGRPWARVGGYYRGRWRHWGWVYMDLLRCY